MLKEDLKHITTENLRDTNHISVRAANCCMSMGLKTFFEIVSYFEDNGSFFNNRNRIRNAGQKTCEILDELCASVIPKIKVKKQYIEIKEVSEVINELAEQELEMLLSFANTVIKSENIVKEKKRIHEKYCADDFSFVTDFHAKNGHLPMFWILEQYIVNDKSREIDILTSTFNIIQNKQKLSLKEIAKKYNLSRERARQIRNDVFRKTFEIRDGDIEHTKTHKKKYRKNNELNLIRYSQILQNKCDWSYMSDFLQETNISQESFAIQECLKKEQCNLSTEFALQVVEYIFRDIFSLFGGFKIPKKDKIWKDAFLIRKDFSDIFDFKKFIERFTKFVAGNKREYCLNIDEFLTNSACWVSVIELNKFDSIVSIVKDILLQEFNLCSNPDGLITIPAMRKTLLPSTREKSLFNVIYEILQRNGNPMHLDEIFIEFKKILPEHKYTEAKQLRSWLQRHEAISFRNRKSVYTLKEWKHVRSGTIRDAIVEFLSENDLPQTADAITEHVLQHFLETNIASVTATMRVDTLNRFSFFNDNSLFGLVCKEYPSEYEETKRQQIQQTFEQRLYDLEKFISENNRFPYSSPANKYEKSLYCWWKMQNRNTEQLSEQQMADIERVKNQYADLDTKKIIYGWFCHFNNLKLFLLENRRLPLARNDEKPLYHWFRRAKDDFSNQKLNEKQRKEFAELLKEINLLKTDNENTIRFLF